MSTPTFADQPARDRIRSDLATNLLVEAGAGSGKTTCLVERMLSLVRQGEPVERIAAVTFTRKAANELRERFQVELERAIRVAPEPEQSRLDLALRRLDHTFLGTIHAFCGRLLRERAAEAGLDPTFEEVDEEGLARLRETFYREWLERGRVTDDLNLQALRGVGIDPRDLAEAFARVVEYPDVRFTLTETPRPDHAECRRQLDLLLQDGRALLPEEEPPAGWDELQSVVRQLLYLEGVHDFGDLAAFADAIGLLSSSACRVTQNRWGESPETKQAAKALGERFSAFLTTRAEPLLAQWRAHRYPMVMRFLLSAAQRFAEERRRDARLGFQDLLMLAADLLRSDEGARLALGERYRRLLVDEFQDTDPVQAEVCFLLTADPSSGTDWREVQPRPGSLFVVGDPKQSIYRFRRADLETYGFVRDRFSRFGAVLQLTQNFRSTRPIEEFVNDFATRVFPTEQTREQAGFAPMHTATVAEARDGVFAYPVEPEAKRQDSLEREAGELAGWIARRIAEQDRGPGDFLILVYQKDWVAPFARALAERNVPVVTTGARLPQERELRELRLLLDALADPGNPVRVTAVLEGLFFGLSHADLYQARRAGVEFTALRVPGHEGPVARAITQLHGWWRDAERLPPDLLLERLFDQTGLLPYAASQPLGEGRAATLFHLLETVRAAVAQGAATVQDAIAAVDRALELEVSVTLQPGRTDVVRVMNLHQAKGLEATVVVLAAPLERGTFETTFHVHRSAHGAEGGLAVLVQRGRRKQLLAHPPDWDRMRATEDRFLAAEAERLLYVAATRARRELVIGQAAPGPRSATDRSIWARFGESLTRHSQSLVLGFSEAPGRRPLGRSAVEIQSDASSATARLQAAAKPSITFETVTGALRHERMEVAQYDLPAAQAPFRGPKWGSAIHRAIEALGRGRSGDSLRTFLMAVVREEGVGDTETERGDAVRELERWLERLRGRAEWRALLAAPERWFELPVMRCEEEDGVRRLTEGVVDALARDGLGYQLLDWKSDAVRGEAWETRLHDYQKQVLRYAGLLGALGHFVAESRVVHLPAGEGRQRDSQ